MRWEAMYSKLWWPATLSTRSTVNHVRDKGGFVTTEVSMKLAHGQIFAGFEELGKRFLLVVSRKPDIVVGREPHHPVTVASIDYVTPNLSSLSFDDGVEAIRLRTTIKAVDRKIWFRIPACEMNLAQSSPKGVRLEVWTSRRVVQDGKIECYQVPNKYKCTIYPTGFAWTQG